MGEYVLYQAIQSFTPPPTDPASLVFHKDDVFEIPVQSPFATNSESSQKPGWLYAYNRRTALEGYVPVECVKLLGSEVNKTVHHPSALGVAVSDSEEYFQLSGLIKIDVDTKKEEAEHKLQPVYFVQPILCTFCDDYIWGQGRVGVKCKGE